MRLLGSDALERDRVKIWVIEHTLFFIKLCIHGCDGDRSVCDFTVFRRLAGLTRDING